MQPSADPHLFLGAGLLYSLAENHSEFSKRRIKEKNKKGVKKI
jgi:hypothetical protein